MEKNDNHKQYNCHFSLSFVGHGIECYRCEASTNWDDCVNRNETSCSSGSDRCLKVHMEAEKDGTTLKAYVRSCTTKEDCDKGCDATKDMGYTIKTCDFSCCDKDLCNGAKVPMASGFLFLACTFAVFVR